MEMMNIVAKRPKGNTIAIPVGLESSATTFLITLFATWSSGGEKVGKWRAVRLNIKVHFLLL